MTLLVDPAPLEANRFEKMRHSMVVSQLRTNAVDDVRVVAAMGQVARENFVPEQHRATAYRDAVLPFGDGRAQNLPLATGRLLTEAAIHPSDHVLLVGAAGGYTAAVLAQLAGSVVALEEREDLVAIARTALASLSKVELVQGPLAAGWADGGVYDVIVIDGAVEEVPEAIASQLKPGGRLVSGLVDRGVTRLAIGRRSEGGFAMVDFLDLECAVLPGFARARTFQF